MRIHWYLLGFGCLTGLPLAACDDDGGGNGSIHRGSDAVVVDAEKEATIWDGGASDGTRPPPRHDAGPDRDMGVPSCFSEGRELQEGSVSDPIAGLRHVRADVDPDGDGQPDLLLGVSAPGGSELRFLGGRDAESMGSLTGPAGTTLELMPGLWPMPDLLTPITLDGAAVWYLIERSEAGVALRVVAAEGGADLHRIELPGGLTRLYVLSTGTGWLALVNQEDGGCSIYSLNVGDALLTQGRCRLRPAWDTNGDGAVEILRTGGDGTTLLDGKLIESVAQIQPPAGDLGFIPISPAAGAPPPGPYDARGQGPELVAARAENGQLFVTYHEPVELRSTGEALPVAGEFVRIEFWLSAEGLRMLVEENRGGLHYLHIYDPGSMRKWGEYGPFPNLSWSGGVDLDGDGYSELFTVTGPRDDGLNDDHDVRSASDGSVLLTLGRERGARYVPFYLRRDGLGTRTDLDGCPGDELALLRVGTESADGSKPTRLHILGNTGDLLFRGEAQSGKVHDLALAELDGLAPVELVEVRSDGPNAARLRVLR